jgi:hypothetical protein
MRSKLRKRNSGGLLSVVLLIMVIARSPLIWAQSEESPVPRVTLGEIKGTPGSSIMMPFSLSADPQNPLQSLSVDIEFVSKSLLFQKTSPGLAAELTGVQVGASVVKEEVDENDLRHVTLRVTAGFPEPIMEGGLPDGLLAYLLFDIAPEAQPFRIRLTPVNITAKDLSSPSKDVANVGSEPGLVVIESADAMFDRLAPPIACFFFSH